MKEKIKELELKNLNKIIKCKIDDIVKE